MVCGSPERSVPRRLLGVRTGGCWRWVAGGTRIRLHPTNRISRLGPPGLVGDSNLPRRPSRLLTVVDEYTRQYPGGRVAWPVPGPAAVPHSGLTEGLFDCPPVFSAHLGMDNGPRGSPAGLFRLGAVGVFPVPLPGPAAPRWERLRGRGLQRQTAGRAAQAARPSYSLPSAGLDAELASNQLLVPAPPAKSPSSHSPEGGSYREY